MSRAGTAVVDGRGARRGRRSHPWIHASNVVSLDAEPGSLARVTDRSEAFVCWAAASPASRIPLRRVSRVDERPDDALFEARLASSVRRRADVPAKGARRLANADADGLPGLVVDWYAGHLVVQATTAWADRVAPRLLRGLSDALGAESVLARGDATVRELEGLPRTIEQLSGLTPDEIVAECAGVERIVDPRRGHKTGLYLDQQENQALAPGLLDGSVLDLFCAEGGFSLPLAVAGHEVRAVDQSETGLDRARRAAERARVAGRIAWEPANAFDVLARLGEEGARFGAVVLDPPPFARRRGGRGSAAKGYKDLHRRAFRLVSGGGRLLTFCCSYHVDAAAFEEAVRAGAEEAGRLVRVLGRPGAAADHTERLELPESRYLKGLLLEVEDGEAANG